MSTEEPTLTLVERAQHGDRSAFELLVERHRSRLARRIEVRMGPEVRARLEVEDVLQETVTSALRSVANFRWQGEWLVRCLAWRHRGACHPTRGGKEVLGSATPGDRRCRRGPDAEQEPQTRRAVRSSRESDPRSRCGSAYSATARPFRRTQRPGDCRRTRALAEGCVQAPGAGRARVEKEFLGYRESAASASHVCPRGVSG